MKHFSLKTFILLLITMSYTQLCSASLSVPAKDSVDTDTADYAILRDNVKNFVDSAETLAADSPARAIVLYKKALRTPLPHSTEWQASIRTKLGDLMHKQKNPEYLAQYATARSLYLKNRNFDAYTKICETLIAEKLKQGKFPESIKDYTDLYSIQSKEGEAVLAGNTATAICNLYLQRKDLKQAFSYADVAKNEYEKVCRRDSLGAIYFKIARIKAAESKSKLAEYYIINKALPYFSASDLLEGRLACFNFLGQMYMNQKKFSQAKWFILQAQTQAAALNDTAASMRALQDLVVIKAVAGNYFLARQDLAKLKEMSKLEGYALQAETFMKRYPALLKKIEEKTTDKHPIKGKKPNAASPVNLAETLVNSES